MKRSNKKGFTLIELLIVVAIMAIIAAVAVPAVMGASNNAKEKAAKTDAGNCKQAFVNAAQALSYNTETDEANAGPFTAANFIDQLNKTYQPKNITSVTVTGTPGNGYSLSIVVTGVTDPIVEKCSDLNLTLATTPVFKCTDGTWSAVESL